MPDFEERARGRLPELFGLEVVDGEPASGRMVLRMQVQPTFLAPNGFLHAAAIVALADTACGYGSVANLPDGAAGFTTVELKSNFLGSVSEGVLQADATLVHGGRTTQVWDATVTVDGGRVLALFRCTQLLLYPR